jgi:translation elongation factor EF-1beta
MVKIIASLRITPEQLEVALAEVEDKVRKKP